MEGNEANGDKKWDKNSSPKARPVLGKQRTEREGIWGRGQAATWEFFAA